MFELSQSHTLSVIIILVAGSVALFVLQDLIYLSGLIDNAAPSPILSFVNRIRQFRAGVPYLLRGPEVIVESYNKSNGAPFVVPTPANNHVFISDPVRINELDNLSERQLSLHAAAKEVLQPKYTYTDHRFEWPDQRGKESVGFNRAIRSHLTNSLSEKLGSIHETLIREFAARVTASKPADDGFKRVPVFTSVKRSILLTNSLIFFGEDLARHTKLNEALLTYMDLVPFCGEMVKYVPTWLAAGLCKLLTKNYRDYRAIHRALAPVVEERLRLRLLDKELTNKPSDGIQWIIDTSPKKNPWTVTRTIDEIIATWISSIHQLSIVASFAVHDLSTRPEWHSKLLAELRGGGFDSFCATTEGLPLMESFIKESARLSPLDGETCRRKVLEPVEFSDGLKVPTGDWVVVPTQAICQDSNIYTQPDVFDPMRFYQPSTSQDDKLKAAGMESHEFTEVSPVWVMWGYGRTKCPGRFFARVAIKLLLSNILLNYELQPQEKQRRHFTWRSVNVPADNMEILLKPL